MYSGPQTLTQHSLLWRRHYVRQPIYEAPISPKLQTDASDRGISAILSQCENDKTEHPLGFYSHKLLPREERYSTVEKECLAIKLVTHALPVYLLGRPFKQTIAHWNGSIVWKRAMQDWHVGANPTIILSSIELARSTVMLTPSHKLISAPRIQLRRGRRGDYEPGTNW